MDNTSKTASVWSQATALVNEIELLTKPQAKFNHLRRPSAACYEPEVYLQLDTYASEGGKTAGEVKQAIRFDRVGAVRLLELIALAFPDLLKDRTK